MYGVVDSTAQSSCGIQVILRDRRGGVEALRLLRFDRNRKSSLKLFRVIAQRWC
jgi:hypothetical protein